MRAPTLDQATPPPPTTSARPTPGTSCAAPPPSRRWSGEWADGTKLEKGRGGCDPYRTVSMTIGRVPVCCQQQRMKGLREFKRVRRSPGRNDAAMRHYVVQVETTEHGPKTGRAEELKRGQSMRGAPIVVINATSTHFIVTTEGGLQRIPVDSALVGQFGDCVALQNLSLLNLGQVVVTPRDLFRGPGRAEVRCSDRSLQASALVKEPPAGHAGVAELVAVADRQFVVERV